MYAHGIQGNFSHHEPCPKCKSKNNLGRWTDGHAFCFGCSYYEPAERKLSNESIRSKMESNTRTTNSLGKNDSPPVWWSGNIAPKALRWLRKYGITDQDILDYDLRYDGRREELILPCQKPAGTGTYQRRYFGPHEDVPKYTTTGSRDHQVLFGNDSSSRCAVMVEGIIDAIKVSRVCRAYPILGADPSQEAIKRLLDGFERVVVWLDQDMLLRASKAVLRASMAYGGARVSRITAAQDPKCYNVNEIKEILKCT